MIEVQLNFTKYEGAGNDFILFDGRENDFRPSERFIASLCDRRFGIGADGVLVVEKSRSCEAEFAMRYYNSDGREAEMCGNGGRCVAWAADRLGIGGGEKLFEAADGLHTARILSREGASAIVCLRMRDVECVEKRGGDLLINTGVPHLVRIVESLDMDVAAVGRELRYSEQLRPEGANINFVRPEGRGHFALRTYERGVEAETLACGTGATASAIAVNYLLQPNVEKFEIEVQGGRLGVEFEKSENRYTKIFLTGPARMVFAGVVDVESF